jgi:hypothetical protein
MDAIFGFPPPEVYHWLQLYFKNHARGRRWLTKSEI